MRGRNSRVVVEVDAPTRATLDGWLHSPTTLRRAQRALATLLLADGDRFAHVAAKVGLAESHVWK